MSLFAHVESCNRVVRANVAKHDQAECTAPGISLDGKIPMRQMEAPYQQG